MDSEDKLSEVAAGLRQVARAITADDAMPAHDDSGNTVASLTEAVLGMTAGLHRIADAISELGDVVAGRD